jgi:hypothetical protein
MKSHPSTSSEMPNRERDVLLATKIAIPRISSELLPRPQLIRRLEESTTHELILVSTPAGFGKTALLATWAQSTERPVAWLSLLTPGGGKWKLNLREDQSVRIRLRGEDVLARPEFVKDPDEVER